MLRFLTAGESHGRALVVIVEGLPAGLPIATEAIQDELARRRLGYGRGPRMKFEQDEVTILGGVRHGRTLGSPVAIEVGNSEWDRNPEKWQQEMSVRAEDGPTKAPLTQVRPGHADLAGMQKYGLVDARDILERASARETAARVAVGTVAKALLGQLGIELVSHVIQMGGARSKATARPGPADLARVDESPVRCFDVAAEEAMVEEIKAAAKDGDSLGGIVEVLAYGVPVGLGSHVHWDRKLDALLARALMSIQAVKGVEIGDGFEVAGRRGSEAHDPISWDAEAGAYRRESSLAGGVEGGMSTGEVLVARAAMKPLATLNRPTLKTVDTATKEETVSFKERTDVTAVPALGVVAETMVALVLADEATRKFGGDSVDELCRNRDAFVANVGLTIPMTGPVVLVGLMGSGKTTVGRRLAAKLDRAFVDADEAIEATTGRTVAELFEGRGEEGFRDVETDVLTTVLAQGGPLVLAGGGGVVLRPANRARLAAADVTVVWLDASPAFLASRIERKAHRPLLAGDESPREVLTRLHAERAALYAEVADLVVPVEPFHLGEEKPKQALAERIADLLRARERADASALPATGGQP